MCCYVLHQVAPLRLHNQTICLYKLSSTVAALYLSYCRLYPTMMWSHQKMSVQTTATQKQMARNRRRASVLAASIAAVIRPNNSHIKRPQVITRSAVVTWQHSGQQRAAVVPMVAPGGRSASDTGAIAEDILAALMNVSDCLTPLCPPVC